MRGAYADPTNEKLEAGYSYWLLLLDKRKVRSRLLLLLDKRKVRSRLLLLVIIIRQTKSEKLVIIIGYYY